MLKHPRLQSVKRQTPRDPDSPSRPPTSGPVQIFHHGLEFPYYDIRQASHATYAKFAYRTLKFHEVMRNRKTKLNMGETTRLPTRKEVENSWLYQLQEAGQLSKKTGQTFIDQMTNREANTIWRNVRGEHIGLKISRPPPKKHKQAVGKPSNLCPPDFRRHTSDVPERMTEQRQGIKRGHDSEDGESNKRQKVSSNPQSKRKNEQLKAKKVEKWAAGDKDNLAKRDPEGHMSSSSNPGM